MPASYLMSWEPTRRRWWKMRDGRRFVVSVRQLRKHFGEPAIPETKDGSYQFANRWWSEQVPAPPPHPHASNLARLAEQESWSHAHGEHDLARSLHQTAEMLKADTTGEDFDPSLADILVTPNQTTALI